MKELTLSDAANIIAFLLVVGFALYMWVDIILMRRPYDIHVDKKPTPQRQPVKRFRFFRRASALKKFEKLCEEYPYNDVWLFNDGRIMKVYIPGMPMAQQIVELTRAVGRIR